jgi:thiol-disulfide isomerase/thioredoxin
MKVMRREALLLAAGAVVSISAAQARAGVADDFDLARYRGKVLYLDFWASWCAPCQLSFHYMDWLVAEMPAREFALLAVNGDHDRRRAETFLRRFGGTVPVLYDPHGALAARFEVKALPTSLLIDRRGVTRFVHDGFHTDQMALYDAQISELLHEN